MLKGQKSFRSLIIASLLIAVTTITATASWTDYLNPFSYFALPQTSQAETVTPMVGQPMPSETPSLVAIGGDNDTKETSFDELISVTSYPFSSTTGATLEDMSTGTATIVAAGSDDGNSTIQNIGFEVWYDGVRFTTFGANANGFASLGIAPTGTSFSNSIGTTANAPKLMPYWDDLWVGTNGKVHFKTIGSAPNRKLVVEWQNMTIPRAGAVTTGAGTFQLWITETSGKIDFVYGSGIILNSANSGYSIGLQSGAATNFASVTSATNTVSYTTAANTQTGAITSGTQYSFTPGTVPNAPTAPVFSGIGTTSLTLSWTDNATNELGFPIYISTDNVTFSYLGQAAANSTGARITGLLPNTTYYFRVFAVAEALLSSTSLDANQTTNPSIGTINTLGTPVTETFDGLQSTAATYTWTDNVTVPAAYSTQATYVAGTGTSTTGGLHSYGVAGTNAVTERALGTLGSGSAAPFTAFRLTNGTGTTIGSLNVSYNGEQWRNGGVATAQTISFQYQVANAGTITDANVPSTGWTSVPALNFTSPIFSVTAGALDGNAPANRTAIASLVTFGVPVAPGQEIWIRWQDIDDTGNDHGLAVDDLTVSANAVPAGPGTVQFSATSYTELEGNTATITVNRTGGSSGAISVDYATGGGSATGGGTCTTGVDYITPTPGTLSWADTDVAAKTFTVQLCNDSDSPETESLNLTLSNPVGTTITGTNPVPLNITDVPAMTYVSSTSTQVTGDVQLGGVNQAIIGIQVVTSGSYLPLNVTQLDLSTNGSTAVSDIVNAKVYYTGTTNTFSTATQFGSTVTSPSGAFNVTGTQALVAGTNYFWVAYDIAPTATVDNFVDAEVSAITVGSVQTPTVTAPAGNRQIKAIVTIPTGNPNGGNTRQPLSTYYGYQRSASIYTAAELSIPINSTIQNMCWYINSSSTPSNALTRVYMKTTTATSFAAGTTVATEEAGATLTYTGTPTLTYGANSYQCLTLSTPFTYTGNNLQVLVETDAGGTGTEGSSAKQFRYSTATNAHQVWEQDTTAPTATSTSIGSPSGIFSTRPNIQFNYAPPVVAPGTLQMSAASYSGDEGSNVNATVSRVSGSSGTVGVTYTLTDGTATSGAACDPGVDFINPGPQLLSFGDTVISQPISVVTCTDAFLEGSQAFTITLSLPTGGAVLGTPVSATGNIIDIPPPFSGTVNVGTGELFTSLTNEGGLFQAINASGATAAFTINITSNLSGELGTHGLNEIAGGHAVTIKPGAADIVVTGVSGVGMIKLNGADNVTINGALGAGTDRNLTFTNTGGGGVIWIASALPTNGATFNTIKNLKIIGGGGTVTLDGINSSGSIYDAIPEAANSNNTIQNNVVTKTLYGISITGVTGNDSNLNINSNVVGSTVSADKIGLVGMFVANQASGSVTENTIAGVTTATTSVASGIQIAGTQNGVSVTRNRISDIKNTNTGGYGANGIQLVSTSTAANVTVANNFIYDVAGYGYSLGFAVTDNGNGIFVSTGGGYNIWNNSVNMATNQTVAGNATAINFAAALATASSIDLRNNIFNVAQTAGSTRYAIYSAASNTVFSSIDYNNYKTTGTALGFIGSSRTALSDIVTGFGGNSNSKEANPDFVSATDLHLNNPPTNLMVGGATPIAGLTVDYDNDPRPATGPDIGADEVVQAVGGSIPAGTYYNAALGTGETIGGDVTITNKLYLNGIVSVGANTLLMDCGASASGDGPASYVNGPMTKRYCGAESFKFPVGLNQYSPVDANVTSVAVNPSTLTATPYDAFLEGFDPLESLSRNWALTETGDLTANLLFYYDDTDVNGNESDYRVWRRENNNAVTNLCSGAPCVDTSLNTLGPVNGVTAFSRWTGSKPLAPTSAAATISGRVTTANGNGIRGAAIVVTGGNLTSPKFGRTGSLGYYIVDGLESGETYVITVVSKRFAFSQPSRILTLNDTIVDADFIADPQD